MVPQWGIRRRRKRGERVNRNEQCDRSKGAVRRLRLRNCPSVTSLPASTITLNYHRPKPSITFAAAKHIIFVEDESIISTLSRNIMLRSNISFFCEAKDIPSPPQRIILKSSVRGKPPTRNLNRRCSRLERAHRSFRLTRSGHFLLRRIAHWATVSLAPLHPPPSNILPLYE